MRRLGVESKLADQPSKGQPAIALNGYGRMRPPARRHGEAFARDSLPRLLAAIPSLTERGSAMSASPLRADMVSVGIDVR